MILFLVFHKAQKIAATPMLRNFLSLPTETLNEPEKRSFIFTGLCFTPSTTLATIQTYLVSVVALYYQQGLENYSDKVLGSEFKHYLVWDKRRSFFGIVTGKRSLIL